MTTNPNPITLYCNEAYPTHNNTPQGKTLLAKNAGVSWATVHKASLGLYSTIPVKLVNYMAANPVGEADHTAFRWNILYNKYVKEMMHILKEDIDHGRIECSALFFAPQDLHKHFADFTEWRESMSYSQMDFCKTFLLHQAILSNYEKGDMKDLPESLKERLRFLGKTEEYIKAVANLPIRKK